MADSGVVAPFRTDQHDHGQCVDSALVAAEELCKSRGVSLTRLRRRVLELIWGRHGPVGAYDILDHLRGERRSAAPTSVYRALDSLLDAGLVHRIATLNAYIGCGDPLGTGEVSHGGQFLICERCGAVAELEDKAIARRIGDSATRLGFRMRRQTVEISGLCPDCASRPGEN